MGVLETGVLRGGGSDVIVFVLFGGPATIK